MLPTFLVIGAPKSGTTAVYDYLQSHPEICLAACRDPDYFCQARGVVDGGAPDGLAFSGNYRRGLAWYTSLFQPAVGQKAIGELSRAYLVAREAPGLIQALLPECRLVFLLRDPVARLYSHYWQERKIGWNLPEFAEMVREGHPRFRHYWDTSAYQRHLEHYLQFFPRSQIAVLLFEDLITSQERYVSQLYQAIGVSNQFKPPGLGQRFNEAGLPRHAGLQRLLVRFGELRWIMGGHWKLYVHLSRIGRWLLAANSITAAYPPLPGEIRQRLVIEFEPHIAYVEAWLDRSLPAWRRV